MNYCTKSNEIRDSTTHRSARHTLTDIDGSSFKTSSIQTAIDIEESSDGTIKLPHTEKQGDILKKLKVADINIIKCSSWFYIDIFDSTEKLIEGHIGLNRADDLTYEAEKLLA